MGVELQKKTVSRPLHVAKATRRPAFFHRLYFLLIATVLITLCSKSSPLYPLNDWVDANCFFTVGKSMLSGLVPYRDLIEQKGPVVYFLHMVAAMLSYRSFFGVYLLEIGAAFVFLWYGYRTCCLLTPHKGRALFLSVIAVLLYTSKAFSHGDSVEELALAPLAYSLYVGVRAVVRKACPPVGTSVAIGILSGMLFWSKFTLVGLYVGWIVMVSIVTLQEQGVARLLRLWFAIAMGLALISLPILGWFYAKGALSDLFRVYFWDNIFHYGRLQGETQGIFSNVLRGYHAMQCSLGSIALLGLLGLFWSCIFKAHRIAMHLTLQALAMFFFLYAGGRFYGYYALPLGLFGVVGAASLADFWQRWRQNGLGRVGENGNPIKPSPHPLLTVSGGVLAIILVAGFAWFFSPNAYLRGAKQATMPQYRFAKIMEQKAHPTLLNVGFLDGGFYTAAGIVPSVPAFCQLNGNASVVRTLQEEAIAARKVDFLVTRGEERTFAGYRLIDRADFFFEAPQHYVLYEKEKNN